MQIGHRAPPGSLVVDGTQRVVVAIVAVVVGRAVVVRTASRQPADASSVQCLNEVEKCSWSGQRRSPFHSPSRHSENMRQYDASNVASACATKPSSDPGHAVRGPTIEKSTHDRRTAVSWSAWPSSTTR